MKITSSRITLALLIVLGASSKLYAELSVANLESAKTNNPATYSSGGKAFIEAIGFSLLQTNPRVKLEGLGKFYLEGGLQSFDVDDKSLGAFTDSLHCPSSFQSLVVKAGLGLPFGFFLSAGLSQVVSEHMLTGLSASLSYQLFDFSTWIPGELIPSMTVDASGMRTISEPAAYSFTLQSNLGAYLRTSRAQFAYLFRFNYSLLTATSQSIGKIFYQHGVMAQIPFYSDWFIRTEVFFPTMTGAALLGYQF
jgi:hypothetical protein